MIPVYHKNTMLIIEKAFPFYSPRWDSSRIVFSCKIFDVHNVQTTSATITCAQKRHVCLNKSKPQLVSDHFDLMTNSTSPDSLPGLKNTVASTCKNNNRRVADKVGLQSRWSAEMTTVWTVSRSAGEEDRPHWWQLLSAAARRAVPPSVTRQCHFVKQDKVILAPAPDNRPSIPRYISNYGCDLHHKSWKADHTQESTTPLS